MIEPLRERCESAAGKLCHEDRTGVITGSAVFSTELELAANLPIFRYVFFLPDFEGNPAMYFLD